MYHGIYLMGAEQLLYSPSVAEINLVEWYLAARDLTRSVQACLVAIGQIVRNYYVVAGLYEFYRNVAAYVSSASGNQYLGSHLLFLIRPNIDKFVVR
jgi:hypothetical protein